MTGLFSYLTANQTTWRTGEETWSTAERYYWSECDAFDIIGAQTMTGDSLHGRSDSELSFVLLSRLLPKYPRPKYSTTTIIQDWWKKVICLCFVCELHIAGRLVCVSKTLIKGVCMCTVVFQVWIQSHLLQIIREIGAKLSYWTSKQQTCSL